MRIAPPFLSCWLVSASPNDSPARCVHALVHLRAAFLVLRAPSKSRSLAKGLTPRVHSVSTILRVPPKHSNSTPPFE